MTEKLYKLRDEITTKTGKPFYGFFDEYRFLSNYQLCSILYEGRIFSSSEAAYQAAKCYHEADKQYFIPLKPNDAKKVGQIVSIRSDWDSIKLQVMEDILRIKFKNPNLADRLLATGDLELIEYNWWNDRFWGVCNGQGENNLGKILMRIRDDMVWTPFS